MKKLFLFSLAFTAMLSAQAQTRLTTTDAFGQQDNTTLNNNRNTNRRDSLGSEKVIPKGLKVWTVDERFGDIRPAEPDTLPHLYSNDHFTSGRYTEYNTTGNLGSPRIARLFIDRLPDSHFLFTDPYDYFVSPVDQHHFTNTYSPITNVSFNTCGNRTNGEDALKAFFAVNAGKRLGVGFQFDYLYGRGYYNSQSTSHFGYKMWGSYLGDRYQAHLLFSTNHEKMTENGGITNDNYITHPEMFSENYATDEIPTVFEQNWNREDNQRVFFSQRYNIGFNRKVPMTPEEIKAKKFAMASKKENAAAKAKEDAMKAARKEGKKFDEEAYDKQQAFNGRPDDAKIAGNEPAANDKQHERISVHGTAAADSLLAAATKEKEDTSWLKNEYVPVTSFIHTLEFKNFRRIYEAYQTPANYYQDTYYNIGRLRNDSIYDQTKHFELKNTFAIAMLEGFNKWAKAGLKIFASHDLRHYELPDSIGGTNKYTENNLSVGGQLIKTQGTLFHYNVTGEVGVVGKDAGNLLLDGHGDLNFKLFGDTVRLAATAFFHRTTPSFYYRHYHARHYWWDNDDLDKEIHSRLMGEFSLDRTETKLRVAYDNLQNYTYLIQSYDIVNGTTSRRANNHVEVAQSKSNISVITAQLLQNLRYGIVNWENILTFQKSSDDDVLPLPTFNIYTNLYLKFRIAHVLNTELGVDARYFTSYYAPDYSPALGLFTVQGNGTDQRVKVGNYPILNAYVNFRLKSARFYVQYSHFNSGSGNKRYFLTPHYPIDPAVIRFGISWTFFN